MACWIITKIVTIVSRRVASLILVFGVTNHVNSSLENNAIDIIGMLKASTKSVVGVRNASGALEVIVAVRMVVPGILTCINALMDPETV